MNQKHLRRFHRRMQQSASRGSCDIQTDCVWGNIRKKININRKRINKMDPELWSTDGHSGSESHFFFIIIFIDQFLQRSILRDTEATQLKHLQKEKETVWLLGGSELPVWTRDVRTVQTVGFVSASSGCFQTVSMETVAFPREKILNVWINDFCDQTCECFSVGTEIFAF